MGATLTGPIVRFHACMVSDCGVPMQAMGLGRGRDEPICTHGTAMEGKT